MKKKVSSVRAIGVKLPSKTHDKLLFLAGVRETTRNRLLNQAVEQLLAEELPKLKAGTQNPKAV